MKLMIRERSFNSPIAVGRIEIWRHIRSPKSIAKVRIKPPRRILLHPRYICSFGCNLQKKTFEQQERKERTVSEQLCKISKNRELGKVTHFQLATMQLRFIQEKSLLNGLGLQKFNISETLRLAKFVGQDSHPVHSSARLKMLLHFLRGASVINLQQPQSSARRLKKKPTATKFLGICIQLL